MAAGQGFKTFTTGEVLTASDVNGYLMQGVLVFASAAARDAAITSPQEGQYAYLKDTNVTYYYDGATWVVSGATGDITSVTAGTGISGGGASGDVTITNSMATAIDAKGDLIAGTADNTFSRLAVGTNGQVLTADSTASTGLAWSTPASSSVTWTGRKTPTGNSISTIAYNGSNLYVAGGSTGVLYSSPDAITWTSRTSGFGTTLIRKIAYGNGLWVAVGSAGVLTTSTDGITWTARTSQFGTGAIYDVKYANSLWVAVGQNSTGPALGISTSTDGITWTARTVTGTIGTTAYSLDYGNGYWVLCAANATNNAAYSTNGTTWTAFATGSATTSRGVLYVNGYWIITAGVGASYYQASVPTGAWTNGSDTNIYLMQTNSNVGWGTYNNKLYWLNTANSTAGDTSVCIPGIINAPVSFTSSTYFDYESSLTFVPMSGDRTASYASFFINSSNGQMIIGDNTGRIYTSF